MPPVKKNLIIVMRNWIEEKKFSFSLFVPCKKKVRTTQTKILRVIILFILRIR